MNITAKRRTWYWISAGLLAASVGSMLIFGFRAGLDFTGGARWHLSFEKPVSSDSVQQFFATKNLEREPQIQSVQSGADSAGADFLITIPDMPDAEIQSLAAGLRANLSDFQEISYRKVDANIGASFKKKAFWAILVALFGIVIFVAFAFRTIPAAIGPARFGGVAIAALFHDILIVLGIFVVLGAIFKVELDLPFITALLATLGFSVNDTIVILDRVRENIRTEKGKNPFEKTIENAIQQTIRRSIYTSISTLLPLFGLLFFGADAIFYFVLALILGISIGTYSSIFLAAPLLLTWKTWAEKHEK